MKDEILSVQNDKLEKLIPDEVLIFKGNFCLEYDWITFEDWKNNIEELFLFCSQCKSNHLILIKIG